MQNNGQLKFRFTAASQFKHENTTLNALIHSLSKQRLHERGIRGISINSNDWFCELCLRNFNFTLSCRKFVHVTNKFILLNGKQNKRWRDSVSLRRTSTGYGSLCVLVDAIRKTIITCCCCVPYKAIVERTGLM